jgi:DNA invertase Pin-like site-specific DNA recombinase
MQAQVCSEAARRAGAASVEVFQDGGYSGTSLRRPALESLRRRLEEFQTIYVWKLDRLSRSVKGFADLMEEFSVAGVGFVSVTEGVDYSGASGRLMMHMLSAVAAFFADLTRERVGSALQFIADSGRWPGGDIYGYLATDKRLVPHPEEAQVVRWIHEQYQAGRSISWLARELNRQGIPLKRRGAAWTHVQVAGILDNPVYTGQMRWHGQVVPAEHEPILTLEQFEASATRRAARRNVSGELTNEPRSLAPLLRCGQCGGPLGVQWIPRGAMRVRHLRCKRQYDFPPDQRHAHTIWAYEKIRMAIWEYVLGVVSEGALQRAAEARRQETAAGPEAKRRAKLERELAQVERLISTNIEAAARGALPMDMLVDHNQGLVARREDLWAELEAARAAVPRGIPVGRLGQLSDRAALGLFLAAARPHEELILLRALFRRVEVFPYHLRLQFVHDVLPPVDVATGHRHHQPTINRRWGTDVAGDSYRGEVPWRDRSPAPA